MLMRLDAASDPNTSLVCNAFGYQPQSNSNPRLPREGNALARLTPNPTLLSNFSPGTDSASDSDVFTLNKGETNPVSSQSAAAGRDVPARATNMRHTTITDFNMTSPIAVRAPVNYFPRMNVLVP